MLRIKNLTFSYPNKVVLHNLHLHVPKGEITTIIGTSGSGKTTLFKILTGMVSPKEGTVIIDGLELPKGHGKAAFMMQDDLLLPWRTVLRNLTLFRELGKAIPQTDEIMYEARILLEEIGLKDCEHMYPSELSGGMRQRVALARCLLQKRSLLLLDEPFSGLDLILREQMYRLLQDVRMKYNTTIVLITHDFRDALTLSDRIFLLSDGSITEEWYVSQAIRCDAILSNELLTKMRKAL